MWIKTKLYKKFKTQEYINMSFLIDFLKQLYKDYNNELTELFIKNDGLKYLLLSLEQFGYNNSLFDLEFIEYKNHFNVKILFMRYSK